MNEPKELVLTPENEDETPDVDPFVREIAEALPGFREYERERREERGLTFGDW